MTVRVRVMLAVAVTLLAVGPATAQPAGPGDKHVLATFGDGSQERRARRDAPPPAPAPARRSLEVWPRLDAGAVLCGSREELVERARLLQDSAPGMAGLPAGCRLIRGATGVAVVGRVPPGATQVRVREGGETGWTDAYLPDRAPGG